MASIENRAVLHIVHLKLLRVTKVLKYFPVPIGDRDSHAVFSLHVDVFGPLCVQLIAAPEGEGLVGWEEEGWGLRSGLLGEMSVSLLCQCVAIAQNSS